MRRRAPNPSALKNLKNIGPKSAARLQAAGIADADMLHELGVVAAYRRVKHAYPRETTPVLLYALAGALADRHWNRLSADLVRRLRSEAGMDEPPAAGRRRRLTRTRSPARSSVAPRRRSADRGIGRGSS